MEITIHVLNLPQAVNPSLVEMEQLGRSIFGYRLHVRLKDSIDGEVYTVRNAMITGHTVSLNADGTMEETMEYMSNVPPIFASGAGTFDTALTCPVTGM